MPASFLAERLHRRVTEAAQEWQRLKRDEGGLYRGALLAQAQEWRGQHEEDLNDLEREFLDASVALKAHQEQEREDRQKRELEQAQALAEEQRQRAEATSKGNMCMLPTDNQLSGAT
jgi:hypothetical protein